MTLRLGSARLVYLLFVPAALILLPFLVLPLALLLTITVGADPNSATAGASTFSHYVEILSDRYYLLAFARTVGIGLIIAGASAALAMPLSYFVFRHPRWRSIVIIMLTGPLLVNVVARLYGWQLLLSDSGPINKTLIFLLGWDSPFFFTGSFTGVVIVMIHVMLPYMAISLLNSMQTIKESVIEAAETLGARSWDIFWRIAVPLAVPGLITGSVIVFSLAASSFVVPAVIGGGKISTFPTLIYQEAMALNFERSAAIAVCLMIVIVPLARLSGALSQTNR